MPGFIAQVIETLNAGSGAQVELPFDRERTHLQGSGETVSALGGTRVKRGTKARTGDVAQTYRSPRGTSVLWLGVSWAHEISSGEGVSWVDALRDNATRFLRGGLLLWFLWNRYR